MLLDVRPLSIIDPLRDLTVLHTSVRLCSNQAQPRLLAGSSCRCDELHRITPCSTTGVTGELRQTCNRMKYDAH